MLESVRKSFVIPQAPARIFFAGGVVSSFLWLLGHDLIHPLVVYFLQLYLAF